MSFPETKLFSLVARDSTSRTRRGENKQTQCGRESKFIPFFWLVLYVAQDKINKENYKNFMYDYTKINRFLMWNKTGWDWGVCGKEFLLQRFFISPEFQCGGLLTFYCFTFQPWAKHDGFDCGVTFSFFLGKLWKWNLLNLILLAADSGLLGCFNVFLFIQEIHSQNFKL